MFKTNSEVIKIEAKKIKPINTGVVFWSHDRGTAKLKFKLMKDNLPQPIPDGTTVPIRLTFSSPTVEGGIGKHDYLATIEDKIGGIVSITLQDNILGYQGIVHGSIYMDFPGDTSLDTAGRFSFEIQRSPIDETTPELEDYYFNGFSKVIDQVEQLIDDTNKRIDGLNTEIDKANGALDRIEDEIKESAGMTEKFINSIDFGDYDYSGNPNLMPYITDPWVGSLLANGDTVKDSVTRVMTHTKTRVIDAGDILSLGLGIPRTSEANNQYLITALRPSTTYTLTVTMSVGSDWTGGTNTIGVRVRYLNSSERTEIPINVLLPENVERDKMITHTFTGTTKADLTGMKNCYVQIFSSKSEYTGTVSVSYDVKLEIGSEATPYQPNLLDAPYYLSKVALGENIITSKSYDNSNYLIGSFNINKTINNGDKLTFTIQGTKPANKQFGMYIQTATGAATEFQGYLTPVEGLTDVWSWSSTAKISQPTGNGAKVVVYQLPPESQVPNGKCTISWAKLEEGDTRTPNIDRLRYKGIGVTKNSINKYLWEENTLLEKIYTNSIDFGGYDYSGNPNLLAQIDFSKLSASSSLLATPPKYVKDYGQYFELDGSDPDNLDKAKNVFIPLLTRLIKGKTYTIRVSMMIDDNFSLGNSAFYYTVWTGKPTATSDRLVNVTPDEGSRNAWKVYTKTFTVPSDQKDGDTAPFLQLYFPPLQKGKLKVGYDIKLEEGSTATPYQPNLLDAPYYLSKVALGENIANKSVAFPIKSSAYSLYQADMEEEFVLGQTYTITIKATKPSIQTFTVYNEGSGDYKYGNLVPVEGLSDTWGLTFTPRKVGVDYPKRLTIIQYPQSTAGACQIDWLKIEKGNTRTPSILGYKYIGEKSIYSNDYKNINWDVTEDYIDNKFNIMVDTVNPQAIGGTKNFLETPFVNGKKILVEEKPLPYEAWHSTGTEQTNIPNKARLIIGPVVTTIGTKLNRSMKENPLTWNFGNWQATANRDCTLLVEGLVRYQFGGSTAGQYGYITFYKDDAQTSSIGFAGGVGINGVAMQWKQGLHFGKIFNLKKGEYFNITFETQNGKKLDFSQINTLHIMEIES